MTSLIILIIIISLLKIKQTSHSLNWFYRHPQIVYYCVDSHDCLCCMSLYNSNKVYLLTIVY